MELNGSPITESDLAALGLVGYGHFTSMRVENHAVRGLSQHMDRLIRDCRTVFDTELDPDRVRELIRHALPDTASPVVVRVTVFDPHLGLGKPGADADPQILVTSREAPAVPSNDQNLWIPGGRAFPEDDRRSHRILIKTSVG
ncbi:aminotransferase class IV, partial [Nocardia farcinica]|uniref:aminotransferase class IV n=1 Tax=Nocardia farcinica TaxID=37329 RepID=UPI002453EFAB